MPKLPPPSKNPLAQASRLQAPKARDGSTRVSFRPIANGYVITRSELVRGKYHETEEYSRTRPTITASIPKGRAKDAGG